MKQYNYSKGKDGEEIARKFLSDKGFQLIDKNYKNNIGEIDLIMVDNDTLIFIEVKLKVGTNYGSPEEMINERKLKQIERVAMSFLKLNPQVANQFQKYRIDAVCIVKDINGAIGRINHYDNLY